MTDREQLEQGTLVVVEERDGFWTVDSDEKGWVTVTQDDETVKVRPSQVEEVPAEDEEDEESGKRMASTLNAYKPNYVDTTTHRGTKSLNNGDRIAELLAGLEPTVVALLADRVLEEEDGHHFARYQHLNPGQIRMNSGNRIRAFCKEGKEWDTTSVEFTVAKAKEMGIGEATEEAAAA